MTTQDNVHSLTDTKNIKPQLGGNGGGGGDDRLRSVEQRLAVIETEIRHLATKEDMERMLSSQLKWFIGIIVVIVVVIGFVSLVLSL